MHFYWLFEVEGALFDHRPNGWELWTARHGGGDGHWDYGWHSAWEEYNKRWSLLGVAWTRRDDPTIPDGYIAVPFSVLTVKNVDNPNK